MPKPRVMIVEDDIVIAESTRLVLIEIGYDVCSVETTGADAVKRACLCAQDVILMDINLGGGMNGIQAAGKIRACSKTPIIFITGYNDKSLMDSLNEYSHFYLTKPYTPEGLQAVIKKALSPAKPRKRAKKTAHQ